MTKNLNPLGKFTVIQGPESGTVFIQKKGDRAYLGRDPNVDFSLNANGISRIHYYTFWLGDQLFIKDYQSTNGTYVNKEKIKNATPLSNNDLIHVGFVSVIKFSYEDNID